jgi:hypothetical protein
VSELDEAWAQTLDEARRRAHAAGRADVAEYLSLRAANDLLRQTGVDWLLQTAVTVAGEANRNGASIQTAEVATHRFAVGSATMVGRVLTLSFGVRALSLEAGWPRAPHDGIVRGGGLACGNIKHRGLKSASEELLLVQAANGSPRWLASKDDGPARPLSELGIQAHITKLLSEKYK